jgi:hypothetical protein
MPPPAAWRDDQRMADRVQLRLELGADGEEPVGSLSHPGTGRSQRFWGWLELIEAVHECLRQLRPAESEKTSTGRTVAGSQPHLETTATDIGAEPAEGRARA